MLKRSHPFSPVLSRSNGSFMNPNNRATKDEKPVYMRIMATSDSTSSRKPSRIKNP